MREQAGNDTETKITHRYGALATSLNEALGTARDVLEPHRELLPEGRMAELDGLLAEFARRRMRIAIYGEVKAGKSTLINAIAGAELSPVAFEPLTSDPAPGHVRKPHRVACRRPRRRAASTTSPGSCGKVGSGQEVVVETNLDLLQLGGQVDLLDTPGVGSEERFDSISADAVRYLDAVVLVVRYPALFTQLSRKLMKGLEAEIGKLFVVWNLDAACTDLTPEERAQHAETLRARVAGAHELHLVDLRAGFRAAARDDRKAVAASGLDSFRTALARFAASDKRQVVALREAAKRADRWLDDAQQALARRKAELDVRARRGPGTSAARPRRRRGQEQASTRAVRGLPEVRRAASPKSALPRRPRRPPICASGCARRAGAGSARGSSTPSRTR